MLLLRRIWRACNRSSRASAYKNIGKPDPWDGENEAVFKTWLKKLSAHMTGAGDNVWKFIKHMGKIDEDDNLGAEDDVKNMIIESKVGSDLNEEML